MHSTSEPRPHLGRNIKRLRELRNMKQESLAARLGVKQQQVSETEKRDNINDEQLKKYAEALEVPVDVIKNFNEEKVISFFASTINNHDQSASIFYNPVFNPIEKLTEVYDQLLKSEREKIALLERLLKRFESE